MNAHLKLVSDHPVAASSVRPNGQALHQLADRMTAEVQAGRFEVARALVSPQNLSPFGIAIVATWMAKAGLSEGEILNAVI